MTDPIAEMFANHEAVCCDPKTVEHLWQQVGPLLDAERAARPPEAELRSLLDEVETLCEDNGQNAILVEDLAALIRDRCVTPATPAPAPADELDVAWAEARSLIDPAHGHRLSVLNLDDDTYLALVTNLPDHEARGDGTVVVEASGPTPAAALLALAAALQAAPERP